MCLSYWKSGLGGGRGEQNTSSSVHPSFSPWDVYWVLIWGQVLCIAAERQKHVRPREGVGQWWREDNGAACKPHLSCDSSAIIGASAEDANLQSTPMVAASSEAGEDQGRLESDPKDVFPGMSRAVRRDHEMTGQVLNPITCVFRRKGSCGNITLTLEFLGSHPPKQ